MWTAARRHEARAVGSRRGNDHLAKMLQVTLQDPLKQPWIDNMPRCRGLGQDDNLMVVPPADFQCLPRSCATTPSTLPTTESVAVPTCLTVAWRGYCLRTNTNRGHPSPRSNQSGTGAQTAHALQESSALETDERSRALAALWHRRRRAMSRGQVVRPPLCRVTRAVVRGTDRP